MVCRGGLQEKHIYSIYIFIFYIYILYNIIIYVLYNIYYVIFYIYVIYIQEQARKVDDNENSVFKHDCF